MQNDSSDVNCCSTKTSAHLNLDLNLNLNANVHTLKDLKHFLSILRIYLIALFAILGFLLNSICIIINIKLNRKPNSSTARINVNKTYVIGLACFDLVKLTAESMFPLVEKNYNLVVTDRWCKFRYWIKYTSGEVCSWILILMSIDRIMAFKRQKLKKIPTSTRLDRYGNFDRSYVTLFSVVAVFSLINSIFFLPDTIYSVSNASSHLLKCQNNNRGFGLDVFEKTWFNLSWFQTFYSLMYSFLPSTILILTSVIIIKIISNYTRLSRRFSKTNGKKINKIKESGLVLVSLSVFFLLSTLPVQISILFIDIYYNDAYIFDLANCFYYLFCIVEASNHSFNFLIYLLIDKTIRNQFYMFFKFNRSN